MRKIQLLDCTLRDGGYINDWEFGHDNLLSIYQRVQASGADIVEIGFLDDRRPVDINRSIMPDTQTIRKIYGGIRDKAPTTVAMIDYGTCKLENIQPCEEAWIDGIRVIFKKHLMHPAMEFCREVKKKGYKVFSQLVSITSYNDEELMQLIELVNDVEPYAVSVVDTYGLLTPTKLLHYYEMLDKHVKPTVSIGFHAHNNLQLAFANAITYLDRKSERDILVDGTLHGMGKSAGNAPLELLALYMNENHGKNYDIWQMLEAIEESIIDIYKEHPWDYKTFFYLSAKNQCHPNYVSFLQGKSNLSVTNLDFLLSQIDEGDQRLLYDKKVAGELYENSQQKLFDDEESYAGLGELLKDKSVLLIGPGKNIKLQQDYVTEYISAHKNIYCISVNYIPDAVHTDMVFVTNSRRFLQLTEGLMEHPEIQIAATSNVTEKVDAFAYKFNREPLLEKDESIVDNSFLMLLKALQNAVVSEVACAGFDGYSDREDNYFNPKMEYSFVKGAALRMNRHIREVISEMREKMEIDFVTYSHYEEKEDD